MTACLTEPLTGIQPVRGCRSSCPLALLQRNDSPAASPPALSIADVARSTDSRIRVAVEPGIDQGCARVLVSERLANDGKGCAGLRLPASETAAQVVNTQVIDPGTGEQQRFSGSSCGRPHSWRERQFDRLQRGPRGKRSSRRLSSSRTFSISQRQCQRPSAVKSISMGSPFFESAAGMRQVRPAISRSRQRMPRTLPRRAPVSRDRDTKSRRDAARILGECREEAGQFAALNEPVALGILSDRARSSRPDSCP